MNKQLTIRGVEEELHRALRNQAASHGLSVNRYVITLLKESVGLSYSTNQRDLEFDDLDHLAGTWEKDEFEAFKSIVKERKIDGEMWP